MAHPALAPRDAVHPVLERTVLEFRQAPKSIPEAREVLRPQFDIPIPISLLHAISLPNQIGIPNREGVYELAYGIHTDVFGTHIAVSRILPYSWNPAIGTSEWLGFSDVPHEAATIDFTVTPKSIVPRSLFVSEVSLHDFTSDVVRAYEKTHGEYLDEKKLLKKRLAMGDRLYHAPRFAMESLEKLFRVKRSKHALPIIAHAAETATSRLLDDLGVACYRVGDEVHMPWLLPQHGEEALGRIALQQVAAVISDAPRLGQRFIDQYALTGEDTTQHISRRRKDSPRDRYWRRFSHTSSYDLRRMA